MAKRRISHQGKTMGTKAWAAYLGINPNTLNRRLSKGWSIERAFNPKLERRKSGMGSPGGPLKAYWYHMKTGRKYSSPSPIC